MSFDESVRAMLVTAALSALLSSSAVGGESEEGEQDDVREALRRGTVRPLSEILTIVSQRAPGNIIKIELEYDDSGTMIYSIKVLGDDGQVRKLKIDARSGQVLRTKTVDPD